MLWIDLIPVKQEYGYRSSGMCVVHGQLCYSHNTGVVYNKFDIYENMEEVHSRAHISLLSQFRYGIVPLMIETGWYTQIPLEFRLCILCDSNLVEDENHFLFQCHFYHTLRDHIFQNVKDLYPEFGVMNNNLNLNI